MPTGAADLRSSSPGRGLEGTVRDRKELAKGASVRLTADHFARLAPRPEGTFRLESLDPGTYTVAASLGRRFASAQVELERPLTRVELLLDDALSVRGRVFDDAGSPVARGARGGLDRPRPASATGPAAPTAPSPSRASPRRAADGLPRRLRDRHRARLRRGRGRGAGPARAGDGHRHRRLPAGRAAAPGAGAGARRRARGRDQRRHRRLQRGPADRGPVTLLAHHSTYGAGEVSVEAPATGVRLKLATLGAVRARLVDGHGKPVAGGKATAWKDDPALQRFDTFSSDVPSGEDGLVVLAGLPAGPHRVRFAAKGYQQAERRNVPVPESGVLDLGDVALEAGKEIAGVVLKDDGPPGRAPSSTPGPRARAPPTGCRPAGRDLRLTGLKDGGYAVSAFLDKAVAEARRAAGDPDVVLRLPAPARLRGRVVERGRPFPRFTIDGTAVEAADGRFEVPRAPGATASSSASAPRATCHLQAGPLGTGGLADAGDVVLDRALAIEGTVQDEAGQPGGRRGGAGRGPGGALAAQDETPARAVSPPTGPSASRASRPARSPWWRGAATGRGGAVLLDEASVRTWCSRSPARAPSRGMVRGPDGKPVDAEVHTRAASTSSDAQGRYRLDELVPGDLHGAGGAGGRLLPLDQPRGAGQVRARPRALDFDLNAGATLRVTVQGASAGRCTSRAPTARRRRPGLPPADGDGQPGPGHPRRPARGPLRGHLHRPGRRPRLPMA